MPQKSKATAARSSIVGKGKSSKVKSVKTAATGAKVTAKAPAKARPQPAAKVAVVQPEQQIAKAKAALKKEKANVKAAPAEIAVAAAVPAAAPAKAPGKARARKLGIEVSANEAASALAAKWALLFKKSDQIESKPYNMKAAFEEKTAIVHKVLGWGYILANRNDRLEVLFKDGIKYLISNYKL